MNATDLLPFWVEPETISDWGSKCQPPIAPAWYDYITNELHPDELIVLFRVIFPAFTTVGSCTLLKFKTDGFSQESLSNFSERAVSYSQFESEFNTLKIYDLFPFAAVSTEHSFELAALLLKRSWEISLKAAFPEKKFIVSMSNTDKDYGPTISFHTFRDDDIN